MTGLEKMKSQILDEAKAAAEEKIAQANAQAGEMIAEAEKEAAKRAESVSRKSEAEVANYQERVASSIDLQKRTKILTAKQEIIADVLNRAYETLKTMGQDEYFALMLKMLEKYALPEAGEMYFSSTDLTRLPSGFEDEVKKIAKAKGGSLAISQESRKIENGFILAYGGIEENCTLKAMLDAKRDDLSDTVHHMLF